MSSAVVRVTEDQLAALWAGISPGREALMLRTPVAVNVFKTAAGAEGIEFLFEPGAELRAASSAGFEVQTEEKTTAGGKLAASLKLVRTGPDDANAFLALCGELVALAQRLEDAAPQNRAVAVCNYIRAWQEFMKASGGELSPERERGLFGELHFLEQMLAQRSGSGAFRLADVWTGPQHNARDFTFGGGRAVEVKTSTKDAPFRAKIESIIQLDSSDFPDLLLAAVKISESDEGRTLEDLATAAKSLLPTESMRLELESLLLLSGFRPGKAGRPLVKYQCDYLRLFRADTLPRITPGRIPGVVSARYEIALVEESGEAVAGSKEVAAEEVFGRWLDEGVEKNDGSV